MDGLRGGLFISLDTSLTQVITSTNIIPRSSVEIVNQYGVTEFGLGKGEVMILINSHEKSIQVIMCLSVVLEVAPVALKKYLDLLHNNIGPYKKNYG